MEPLNLFFSLDFQIISIIFFCTNPMLHFQVSAPLSNLQWQTFSPNYINLSCGHAAWSAVSLWDPLLFFFLLPHKL